MARLTQYMGIVHLGGAFDVRTTRIQIYMYTLYRSIEHSNYLMVPYVMGE